MSSKIALLRVIAGGILCGVLSSAAFWPMAEAAPAPAKGKGKAAAAKVAPPPPMPIPNFAPESNTGWLAAGTEFIAMPGNGPKPVAFDKKYPYVPNGTSEQPTFRVADLDNPILLPWVKDVLKRVNDRAISGKDAFPPQVRCWPLGVPGFVLYPAQPVFIVQTPKEVLMTWQADHMVRRIFLTDKHSETVKPSWFGESIGHYENGDTLVVDTIGITTKTFVDNYRTPHTEKLHVVERFRLAPDGQAIEVTITVDDPGAFTMPWTAMQRYRRVDQGPMIEATCVEGNFNYYNFDLEPLPEEAKPSF
jgi:hypothetical protein